MINIKYYGQILDFKLLLLYDKCYHLIYTIYAPFIKYVTLPTFAV